MPIENYHRQTHPKARKDHQCCECTGTILPGESYHRRNGCQDGVTYDYKTCTDCESLYQRICQQVPAEDRPTLGKLREFISQLGLQGVLTGHTAQFVAIAHARGVRMVPPVPSEKHPPRTPNQNPPE